MYVFTLALNREGTGCPHVRESAEVRLARYRTRQREYAFRSSGDMFINQHPLTHLELVIFHVAYIAIRTARNGADPPPSIAVTVFVNQRPPRTPTIMMPCTCSPWRSTERVPAALTLGRVPRCAWRDIAPDNENVSGNMTLERLKESLDREMCD